MQDLLSRLAGELAALSGPKLLLRGQEFYHRTNDPTGEFLGRWATPTRGVLETVARQRATVLNCAIGKSTDERGTAIAGIAGVVIQLDPDQALETWEQAGPGSDRALVPMAARMLDLPRRIALALLAGPSWAGDMAGWIRPEEAREAAENARTAASAEDVWRHLNRSVMLGQEQAFHPRAEAVRRRMARAGAGELEQRPGATAPARRPGWTRARRSTRRR